jgi:hypothetical protein
MTYGLGINQGTASYHVEAMSIDMEASIVLDKGTTCPMNSKATEERPVH